MPSYLATIRIEALGPSAVERAILEMHNHGVSPEIWTVVPVDADSVSTEAVAAVRALSPAVVEELRQMWRADVQAEARKLVRELENRRPR